MNRSSQKVDMRTKSHQIKSSIQKFIKIEIKKKKLNFFKFLSLSFEFKFLTQTQTQNSKKSEFHILHIMKIKNYAKKKAEK